jgi:hypothetical protein
VSQCIFAECCSLEISAELPLPLATENSTPRPHQPGNSHKELLLPEAEVKCQQDKRPKEKKDTPVA